MSMTPAQELALVEQQLQNMLTDGLQRYGVDRRTGERLDFKFLTQRREQLKAEVQRQSAGAFAVAQNRGG